MNLIDRIEKTLRANRKYITFIGDAMLDVWIHGQVTGCQEECQKFMEASRITTPGGAANAKRCLSRWPVDTVLFAQDEKRRPIKNRFVNSNGLVVFRHDNEVEAILSSGGEDRRFQYSYAAVAAGSCDAVVLSDYDKGFLTKSFISEIDRKSVV